MSKNRKPMTVQGKVMLENRLKHLVEVERPQVVQAIEIARGHGDLSENADYSAAKERQAHIEGKIVAITDTLSNAEVVDVSSIQSNTITFGAHVSIEDEETGEQKTYQIVGEDEANVQKGKISINSPLARQLIGKKKEDSFEFHSPGGENKDYYIHDFFFK